MKILKNILLYVGIATSLFGIILSIFGELIYMEIFKHKYYGIFALEFKVYYIFINLSYCIIGIILFIIYKIKNKIIFLKKYLLLIPSIIISIYLIWFLIMIVIYNQPIGMGIPILFIIGSPLFLFYYLNQDNKIIILTLLCFAYPISIVISLIEFIGIMGI